MGCFNSIIFRCPRCGGNVEAQSKGGTCSMSEYRLDNAPPKDACDVIGDTVYCDSCPATFTVRGQVFLTLD